MATTKTPSSRTGAVRSLYYASQPLSCWVCRGWAGVPGHMRTSLAAGDCCRVRPGLGLVMAFSASFTQANRFDQPTYYLLRQLRWVAVGACWLWSDWPFSTIGICATCRC